MGTIWSESDHWTKCNWNSSQFFFCVNFRICLSEFLSRFIRINKFHVVSCQYHKYECVFNEQSVKHCHIIAYRQTFLHTQTSECNPQNFEMCWKTRTTSYEIHFNWNVSRMILCVLYIQYLNEISVCVPIFWSLILNPFATHLWRYDFYVLTESRCFVLPTTILLSSYWIDSVLKYLTCNLHTKSFIWYSHTK